MDTPFPTTLKLFYVTGSLESTASVDLTFKDVSDTRVRIRILQQSGILILLSVNNITVPTGCPTIWPGLGIYNVVEFLDNLIHNQTDKEGCWRWLTLLCSGIPRGANTRILAGYIDGTAPYISVS